MRNQELNRQLQSIKSLISRTGPASSQNIQLQGHWGKYLCILTSGFIENSLKEVYSDFVKNASGPQVAKFAISQLNGIQNPKSSRFLDVARSFNEKWANDLSGFLDDELRGAAIDGIMSNRHLIAHGRNANISVARVNEYLDKCVEVIEFIENQCHGP